MVSDREARRRSTCVRGEGRWIQKGIVDKTFEREREREKRREQNRREQNRTDLEENRREQKRRETSAKLSLPSEVV